MNNGDQSFNYAYEGYVSTENKNSKKQHKRKKHQIAFLILFHLQPDQTSVFRFAALSDCSIIQMKPLLTLIILTPPAIRFPIRDSHAFW